MSQYGPFMMQNISRLLRNERQRRNLTESQAATECQLSEDNYLRIESAKKALNTRELIAVSAFLKQKPEVLLNLGTRPETIKYRTEGDPKEASTSNTVEKAKRLFEEMIAQSLLREN